MGNKGRIFTYAIGGIGLAAMVASIAIAAAPDWSGGMHDGDGHRHGDSRGHGRPFLGLLKEMDADGSGSVTRTEIAAFNAARAAEMDADKDGQITVAEVESWREAQRVKRLTEQLAAMDSDGDGKVSLAEHEAAATWRLARLDRDGDGMIELGDLGRQRGPGAPQGDDVPAPDGGPAQ
jgi:Ca2+-binding EF-hand superfamily protein